MQNKFNAWEQGFVTECKEPGIDAYELLKSAQMTGRIVGNLVNPLAQAAGGMAAGYGLNKLRNISGINTKPTAAASTAAPSFLGANNYSPEKLPTYSDRAGAPFAGGPSPYAPLATRNRTPEPVGKPEYFSPRQKPIDPRAPAMPQMPAAPRLTNLQGPLKPPSNMTNYAANSGATLPTPPRVSTPVRSTADVATNMRQPSQQAPQPTTQPTRVASTPSTPPTPVTRENAQYGWSDRANRAYTQQERQLIDSRKGVHEQAQRLAQQGYSPYAISQWQNKAWQEAGTGSQVTPFQQTPNISGVIKRPGSNEYTRVGMGDIAQGGGFQGGTPVDSMVANRLYAPPQVEAQPEQVAQQEFTPRRLSRSEQMKRDILNRRDAGQNQEFIASGRQGLGSRLQDIYSQQQKIRDNYPTQVADGSLPELNKTSESQEKWAEGFDTFCNINNIDAVELLKYANDNYIGADSFSTGFRLYCEKQGIDASELIKEAQLWESLKKHVKQNAPFVGGELGIKGLGKLVTRLGGIKALLPFLGKAGLIGGTGLAAYGAGRGLNHLSGGAIDRVGAKAWSPFTDWMVSRQKGVLPVKEAGVGGLLLRGLKGAGRLGWKGTKMTGQGALSIAPWVGFGIVSDMLAGNASPETLTMWQALSPTQKRSLMATLASAAVGGVGGTALGAMETPDEEKGETRAGNIGRKGFAGILAGGAAGLAGSTGLSMLENMQQAPQMEQPLEVTG